jgi:phospholipase C
VIDPAGLDRLDRIDTFIVVMMENRSFDHLLGYLRQRNDQYEGLTGNESNPPPPDRQGAIRVQPVAEVLTTGRVTQIPVSPYHHTDHVAAQMNGGAMDGFVRDFASRTDFVELVMTYYGGSAGQRGFLPVHDRLALEFSVCDHWFSAHPGPTWPNRWAMLMGQIPELENLDIDDPRIGFLRERTIFDALRSAEPPVDFRCYHKDVTMLRMYNRYRLDDRSVLPFDDPDEGFEKVAREGRLPPVVFIDPNFVDMPPVGTADDDHPPADLRRGQDFLKRVFDAVVSQGRGRWQSSLLLITYDEHGGFFDHVAPPGTPAARPDLQAAVPRLHPEGPTFMGPRVPTFVVSPWVGAGSVCKAVFDHTSIFKTLVVRFRNRLRWGTFPLSERVKAANHLGAALDQQQPRSDVPAPFERGRTRRRIPGDAFVSAKARRPLPMQPADGDRQDFHAALARAGFPKR